MPVTASLIHSGNGRAGIVGLQTALVLKDAGLDVVIVAKDFPGSEDPLYTSKWFVFKESVKIVVTLTNPHGVGLEQ